MPKPSDIRLLEIHSETERFAYRTPIKFGGRVVTDAVVLDMQVEVETRDGRRARGIGSMSLGNAWAWPSSVVSVEDTLRAVLRMAKLVMDDARAYRECGHPLEITHDLAAGHARIAAQVKAELSLTESMPRLPQLLAASPLEAGIHDAYGKVLGRNSYDVLGPEFVNRDLAAYLTPEFRGEYLDRYTLRSPKPRMPLYHLVGALDPLTDADISQRIDDGLPETLPEWIRFNGLTHLKLKLNGDDLAWDVDRVVTIERVAAEAQHARGCPSWHYSLDFNERCASVQYVLDFLRKSRNGRRRRLRGFNISSSRRIAT